MDAAPLHDGPAATKATALPVCPEVRLPHYTPGSPEDFDRLYRASYSRILYTLVGMVGDIESAEDCAQEAFERAFRAWKSWKPNASPEVWLHRIAVNVAMSHHRWRRLRRVGEIIRRLGAPVVEEDPVDVELHSDLQRALRQLPPKQAAAIVLRHYHGYTNREIASVLGVPERTVAWRLASAKERLRRELGDLIQEGPEVEPGTLADARVSLAKARMRE